MVIRFLSKSSSPDVSSHVRSWASAHSTSSTSVPPMEGDTIITQSTQKADDPRPSSKS